MVAIIMCAYIRLCEAGLSRHEPKCPNKTHTQTHTLTWGCYNIVLKEETYYEGCEDTIPFRISTKFATHTHTHTHIGSM